MAKLSRRLQFKRGTEEQHKTFTGAEGEVTVVTDDWSLRVHDGVTAGGYPVNGKTFTRQKVDGTQNITAQMGYLYTLGESVTNLANVFSVPYFKSTTETVIVTTNVSGNNLLNAFSSDYVWYNKELLETDDSDYFLISILDGVASVSILSDNPLNNSTEDGRLKFKVRLGIRNFLSTGEESITFNAGSLGEQTITIPYLDPAPVTVEFNTEEKAEDTINFNSTWWFYDNMPMSKVIAMAKGSHFGKNGFHEFYFDELVDRDEKIVSTDGTLAVGNLMNTYYVGSDYCNTNVDELGAKPIPNVDDKIEYLGLKPNASNTGYNFYLRHMPNNGWKITTPHYFKFYGYNTRQDALDGNYSVSYGTCLGSNVAGEDYLLNTINPKISVYPIGSIEIPKFWKIDYIEDARGFTISGCTNNENYFVNITDGTTVIDRDAGTVTITIPAKSFNFDNVTKFEYVKPKVGVMGANGSGDWASSIVLNNFRTVDDGKNWAWDETTVTYSLSDWTTWCGAEVDFGYLGWWLCYSIEEGSETPPEDEEPDNSTEGFIYFEFYNDTDDGTNWSVLENGTSIGSWNPGTDSTYAINGTLNSNCDWIIDNSSKTVLCELAPINIKMNYVNPQKLHLSELSGTTGYDGIIGDGITSFSRFVSVPTSSVGYTIPNNAEVGVIIDESASELYRTQLSLIKPDGTRKYSMSPSGYNITIRGMSGSGSVSYTLYIGGQILIHMDSVDETPPTFTCEGCTMKGSWVYAPNGLIYYALVLTEVQAEESSVTVTF